MFLAWMMCAASAAELVPPRLLIGSEPAYPEEAVPDGLTGLVVVTATVGEDGSVIDATYTSGGPAVFVAPALAAARRLVFAPATHEGAPQVVSVPVTFHFEPPGAAGDVSEEIEVVSRSAANTETHAVTTIGVEALDRAGGENLADTLSQVSGVVAARGSANVAKPILRGQSERRLLTLFDGVRHESQKWGLDHAPEIDPFAAGSLSVVKGAAGVRYGPDAIGGVILVAPPPLREEAGVDGRMQLVGASNGLRGTAAARVDAVSARWPALTTRLEANVTKGAALRAPDYVLGNTASTAWNAAARAGWRGDGFRLEAAFHHYDFTGGVCYCQSSDSASDFFARLDAPVPIGSEGWTVSYAVDRPKQQVRHDLALLRSDLDLGATSLSATYAFQLDRRREYDQVRANITGAQYDFLLRSHTLDVFWSTPERPFREGRLTGGVGASGLFQENVYSGLPLLPNYRVFTGGVFATQRYGTSRTALEVGGRVDHQSRATFLTTQVFAKDVARGALTEDDCLLGETSARCPARYDTGSLSLGGVWQVGDRLEARIDFSTANRFPNADELFLNGSAPSSPVYAVGDPRLGVETTRGASPTLTVRVPDFEGEVSGYANAVDNYIYFAPTFTEAGAPVVNVTVQGAFPEWEFTAIDALFYGLDGAFTVGSTSLVSLTGSGSMVRAIERSTGDGLILTPPDRGAATVRVQPHVRGLLEAFVEVETSYVARQTRVDLADDLAPPPPGYGLLGAALGGRFTAGGREWSAGIQATNLLNTTYREYTSLLRYSADEPGRDVRLRLSATL